MTLLRRKILITSSDILPGLQKGLNRREAPDYILSKTYARILGDDLPRREVLLKLAATLAFASVPIRTARAVPLAAVAILLVACGAQLIPVFKRTFGRFTAENNEEEQQRGYVEMSVYDLNSDAVEGSQMVRYSFPANTSIDVIFKRGPAPTTKGDKSLEVAGEDSSESDDFTAT